MNAIVIGGGPAGSLAAILLARGGRTVTLIEQSRFPRDKVCGECLSALGLQVLRRHGLDAALLRSGRRLATAHLFGRTARATLVLPSPMLGVSRALMDKTLLDAARDAGVRVRQPARAEAVSRTSRGATVRVRDLIDNAVTDESADVVLIADGRDALGPNRRPPSGDLGVKAHFEGVAADPAAITLYGGFGCYGGVAPVEAGRWNVAFSVPRETVAAVRGDLSKWWQSLLAASPTMAGHFAPAGQIGDWLASPLPRHPPARTWPDGTIPIGAAAGAIEPVGGEGMGTALRSAELAAAAILDDQIATLPTSYASLWNRRGLFCRVGGRMLADEQWSDGIVLTNSPAVAAAAMWLIGK